MGGGVPRWQLIEYSQLTKVIQSNSQMLKSSSLNICSQATHRKQEDFFFLSLEVAAKDFG